MEADHQFITIKTFWECYPLRLQPPHVISHTRLAMSPRGPQYLDLQPFLERVCDQMGVGELLHDESFSLFESMTAIEIGDPKMDLALRRHQDVGTPEELIAAGQAPIDLSAPQLLGLMDQLMVMEAAWHCGAMLPQTVYTSLYMLQIDRCGMGRGEVCTEVNYHQTLPHTQPFPLS